MKKQKRGNKHVTEKVLSVAVAAAIVGSSVPVNALAVKTEDDNKKKVADSQQSTVKSAPETKEEAVARVNAAQESLDKASVEYDNAVKANDTAIANLKKAQTEYDSANKTYNAAYEAAKDLFANQIDDKKVAVEDAQAALDGAKKSLAEANAQYKAAEKQVNDAKQAYDLAQKKFNDQMEKDHIQPGEFKSQLMSNKDELVAEKSDLDSKLNEAQKSLDKLNKDYESSKNDVADINSEINAVHIEISKKNSQIKISDSSVSDAKSDVAAAKKSVKQAEEDLKNVKPGNPEKLKLGAFGWFEDMGKEGEEPLYILNNCTYHNRIQKGNPNDATSVANVRKAFEKMKESNKYRDKTGAPHFKTSYILMAMGMANADATAMQETHTRQNYEYYCADNLSWGYSDPFYEWYYNDASSGNSHKRAIDNPEHVVAGYGVCFKRGSYDKYSRCDVQVFGCNKKQMISHGNGPYTPHETKRGRVMTIEEAERSFENWVEKQSSGSESKQEAQAKLKKAKAQLSAANDELDRQIAKNKQLKSQLSDLRASLVNKNKKQKKLLNVCTEAKNNVAKAQNKLDSINEDIKSINSKISIYEDAINKLNKEASAANFKSASSKEDIDVERLVDLYIAAQEAEKSYDDSKLKLEDMKANISSLEGKVETAQAAKNFALKELDSAKETVVEFNGVDTKLDKGANSTLVASINKLKDANAKLESAKKIVESNKTDVAESKKQFEDAKVLKDDAQEQLELAKIDLAAFKDDNNENPENNTEEVETDDQQSDADINANDVSDGTNHKETVVPHDSDYNKKAKKSDNKERKVPQTSDLTSATPLVFSVLGALAVYFGKKEQ